MTGYCEACRRETHGEQDEYGINVCIVCGCDLVVGVHVEPDRYIVSEAEEADLDNSEDFNDFLNQD